LKYAAAMVLCFSLCAGACQAQVAGDANATAANSIDFSIANIKRGKQFYALHCISCHGADGRGDTEMREFLKTPPADLSDDQWLYGGSEEAVFTVIKNGMEARDMPGFGEKLNDQRVWQVVSYIKYLRGVRP
jgi:cbb3-type cytochrome c oxidase subunit III